MVPRLQKVWEFDFMVSAREATAKMVEAMGVAEIELKESDPPLASEL